MQYAHFVKICEKCGKVPNMRQSHIRVFLTCLVCECRQQQTMNHVVDMCLLTKFEGGLRSGRDCAQTTATTARHRNEMI